MGDLNQIFKLHILSDLFLPHKKQLQHDRIQSSMQFNITEMCDAVEVHMAVCIKVKVLCDVTPCK